MTVATADYELLSAEAGAVVREGRAVIELAGSEAAEFLQGQVSQDVEAIEPGAGAYATLLDHKGKIRTDLRVLRLAEDRLLVDAESIGLPVLLHVFQTFSLGRDVRTSDMTRTRAVVSLIGPAARVLVDPSPPAEEHRWVEALGGIAVATDLGLDLIVPTDELPAALALAPAASEEAAECVRIESGRPRLGLDMGSTTIPQEAGLNERAVSFEKGCYVGQETVARLHWRGRPNRHLRGLRLSEPAVRGEPITLGERELGTLGSTYVSPTFGPIALALVRREAGPGDEVSVAGAPATVVELPFERE